MNSSGNARKSSKKERPPLPCPDGECGKIYVMPHFFKKHLKDKHGMERVELILEQLIGEAETTKRGLKRRIKLEILEPFERQTTVASGKQSETVVSGAYNTNTKTYSSTCSNFPNFHNHVTHDNHVDHHFQVNEVHLNPTWQLQGPFPTLQQNTVHQRSTHQHFHSTPNWQAFDSSRSLYTSPRGDVSCFQESAPILPQRPANVHQNSFSSAQQFQPISNPYAGNLSCYPNGASLSRFHLQPRSADGQIPAVGQLPINYHSDHRSQQHQPNFLKTSNLSSNANLPSTSSASHHVTGKSVNTVGQQRPQNVIRTIKQSRKPIRIRRTVHLPSISSVFSAEGSVSSLPGSTTTTEGSGYSRHTVNRPRPAHTREIGGGYTVAPNTFTPNPWGSYQQFDQYKREQ